MRIPADSQTGGLVQQEMPAGDESAILSGSVNVANFTAASTVAATTPPAATAPATCDAAPVQASLATGRVALVQPVFAATAAPTAQLAVPLAPVAVPAPVDPLQEAPQAMWYVHAPTGGRYGPANRETMGQWISEGRVSADSLVWREGWPDWKLAGATFPQLAALGPPPSPPASVPRLAGVASGLAVPAAGPAVGSAVPGAPWGAGAAAGSPRPGPRSRRRSNSSVLAAVITLCFLTVVLLVALVVVLNGGS